VEVLFGEERLLVPTGKIEKHVLKEVLAKSVGDTASFLQFPLGMQKYLDDEVDATINLLG